MTSTELWEAYATRNPSFDGPGQVTLSAAGLRKLFDQTWSIAHDSGYRKGQRESALRSKIESVTGSTGLDFFNQAFGDHR